MVWPACTETIALQKLADEAEQKLAVGFQRGLEVAQCKLSPAT